MKFVIMDIGNSKIKYALIKANKTLMAESFFHKDYFEVISSLKKLNLPIFAVNVANKKIEEEFNKQIPNINWVSAQQKAFGIENLYQNPQQLGNDRFVAMIGARALTQIPTIIVSAGTALTVDALNAHGKFFGGTISPGLRSMINSLINNTANLKDGDGELTDFPRKTSDAIYSGCINSMSGAILIQIQKFRSQLAANFTSKNLSKAISMNLKLLNRPIQVVLTGGDGSILKDTLELMLISKNIKLTVHPNLVLLGLTQVAKCILNPEIQQEEINATM